MKRLFFIYSLPRSGSSWLSVFLSQPGCYCYHEPLVDGNWHRLWEKLASRKEQVVGAIDTSAYRREWPERHGLMCYVLKRSLAEIKSSSERVGFKGIDYEAAQKRFEQVAYGCPPIEYSCLDSIDYLRWVWDSITLGLPFDRERTQDLMEMRIERSISAVIRRHRCAIQSA